MAQGRPQLKRPADIPQEKPPEEKKPKKVKGPRAVGVLQLNSKGKGTLIPIAILVDGKFRDASVYKADPVPMALDSGTIYEVEETGDSQGLFTVSGALHSGTAGSVNPWLGQGSFLPNGSEEAKSTRKAENVPRGLDNTDSDAPPRLTRGNAGKAGASNTSSGTGSNTAGTAATTAGAESSGKPGATGASSGSPSQSTKGSSTTASGGAPAGQDAPKSGAAAASEKPVDQSGKSADKASQDQASQGQTAENYYRPTLRRGRPTQSAPEDEDEPALKTGKTEAAGVPGGASATPLRLVPAISDSGGPDPRAYKFFWKAGEDEERRNQMLALAGDEVRAYANAQAKNRIPANPPATKTSAARHKAPAKPAQPIFENIQFRAFDLWLNNQPVMILSAEAQMPSETGAAASDLYTYSITLAARTDIYGNLRKLYAGVTDKFHLDVTPRLELIDAVDADGDGRGELLFRETTDGGSGYVIYRATGDTLWKMFDSMGEQD